MGSALLSAALALTAYALAGQYLLQQRQSAAVDQAYVDARLVKQELNATTADVASVLSALAPGKGTRVLVLRGGRWFSTSVAVSGSALPAALTTAVEKDNPASQRIVVDGKLAVSVGVPIPSIGVDYFEVYSLDELQRTLEVIGIVLLVVAVATSVVGAAIGRWGSGYLIRPIRGVAQVAGAIASGSIDQRLALSEDPDLDPLVESFNGMVEALHQRIDREMRFTADVSHELRSPVTAVRTSAEVLEGFRSSLPPEGGKALDLLAAETGRFSDMLQDLLEISRVDAGAAHLVFEEVRLEELLAYAARNGRSVPVRVERGAGGATVNGDKRILLRVMENLLQNAEVHAGGATLVSLAVRDGAAQITVDDAGPGVRPGERHLIFERFHRGSGASGDRRGGGSGLGLALVDEHVRAHGGTVSVVDRPGGGSRFVVTLPLMEEPSA
jgi:signal transduction histidine kinase